MAALTAVAILYYGFNESGAAVFPNHLAYARLSYGITETAPRTRYGAMHYARAELDYGFDITGKLAAPVITDSLMARDVILDLLRLWGSCGHEPDDCLKSDVIACINGAMQYIHAMGRDLPYLAQRTRYYFVDSRDGPNGQVLRLETDIQQVEGSVRAAHPWQAFILILDGLNGFPTPPTFDPFAGSIQFSLTFDATSYTIFLPLLIKTPDELQTIIQGLIVNEARCWVTYKPKMYLKITFDVTPAFMVKDTGDPGGPDTLYLGGPDTIVCSDGDLDFTVNSQAIPFETGDIATPLTPLYSRMALEQYTAMYGSDAPQAYYLERQHLKGTDSAQVYLMFAPQITSDTIIAMNVQVEPGRISWADFYKSTAVPMPHRYVESLLLPICRWRATAHRNYRQRERHQSILDQYADAQRLLGVVDPQTSPVKEGKEAAST